MDSKEKEKEAQNKSRVDYSFPISEYAKQLDFPVRDRYLQKIAAIGIDPVLVEGKDFKPDCLPPVESTDILWYLVLETSFYTQEQFKAFRSPEAYNQMVSGFIASVQGHIIADKFLVLAKVRHSQHMNDSLISCWVITEREGTILFAHCLGCKAGLAETCSHIASVLFYLEAWTKINGRLACTQVKCSWLLPTYVKQVEYEKVREINFTSARKMKNDLDAKIENLSNVSSPDNSAKGNVSKEIPVPSKPEMDTFYAKLSKSSNKPIALYADSYILKSRCVPTISDLFDKKYLALSYPELLKACQEVDIEITKEQILQVERDTVAQAKGNSFFRHRAVTQRHFPDKDHWEAPVISKELKELVEALLGPNFQGISNIPVQQQMNVSDCGVFAIAFATCLVYGQNPCNVIFDIPRMRQHLHRCLRAGMMQLFPTT
ncbi:unnamed protein product [Pocillopora meandrina]|uniref:Ubiquitin-like protease family profile domain-containing protein n=1 Tax=Pocillopora meandrina TaxID=46732 RepID=A0AAU9VLJ1_9CNID|nr:unnamed protein product [Pocillopora meandrina]